MANKKFVITTDQKPSLVSLVKRLPAILAGRIPDEKGVGAGFRARIGYTMLSLIEPNFNALGRGEPGADGTKWAPLSPEYLAYGRRFAQGERKGIINAKGFHTDKSKLSPQQLKEWNNVYKNRLAQYALRQPLSAARDHASATAWLAIHGKTKLQMFGDRKVQILVDTGYLRGSLTPGTLNEKGVEADYIPPNVLGGSEQVFDVSQPYQIIVGTNVEYAKYHHEGKGKRYRPLWPVTIPEDWWNQILGVAMSGLQQISELFR